jgi:hypothetical protein
MKQSDFATLLNRMGYTRAKYGGVLVKKVKHGSDLSIHVVPWKDAITDQVDIRHGLKIERHFYTPADLKEMTKNSGLQNVDEAIATAKRRRPVVGSDGPVLQFFVGGRRHKRAMA